MPANRNLAYFEEGFVAIESRASIFSVAASVSPLSALSRASQS